MAHRLSRQPHRSLVTGGAGFIGRSLTRALLAAGDDVVVLDDGSTGLFDDTPSGATLVVGDIRDRECVEDACRDVTRVFHLAAAVGPQLVADDPVGTWSRNVEGTGVVLRQAAAVGARVVFASSSEVYGADYENSGRPMVEGDAVSFVPSGRRELYAISKLAGESAALAFHRAQGLEATVVRLFNVVGPGQRSRYGMVMARFADAIRAGKPLEVYGDGTQRRCFLHVDDAVRGLIGLSEASGAIGEIVNLGSDAEISIGELATRCIEAAAVNLPIRRRTVAEVYGEGFRDPQRRCPDLTVLRSLIDWHPDRDLDDIVRDVLQGSATYL